LYDISLNALRLEESDMDMAWKQSNVDMALKQTSADAK
jgi:hypothetical protein